MENNIRPVHNLSFGTSGALTSIKIVYEHRRKQKFCSKWKRYKH